MKYLILDVTNVLYRTFYAHKKEDEETITGLALHSAIVTMNKHFRDHKPDKVIMTFDRHSWRKDYTASDTCISKKPYKGNRRQNLTPKEKEKYEAFKQHLSEFENLIREHTSIITLAADGLEADDLIAGTIQVITTKYPNVNNEFVIVSGDKDMIQLLKHPNTILVDPATGKQRTLEEWDNDAGYFMFEKCIRGDTGDNVQSALPRCRKTRIKKAYKDDFERSNLMMETWTHVDGREFVVKKLFNENRLLMDLESQPEEIRELIVRTVLEGLNNPGEFSYFHILKFMGKYELNRLAEQIDNFVSLFSR